MIKKYMLLLIKRFHESKSINNKRLYDGILISYMPGSLASWYRELYNVALLFL